MSGANKKKLFSKFNFSQPKQSAPKTTEKKGEINELKAQLRDPAVERDPVKRREALKKVIAYMTLGIDTTPLFSEIILASATKDLVQKKMVYLYLTTHAESSADIAILAINTLQKDCKDESPLVRGLALRAISSMKLPNILDYLTPLVQKALVDQSPYVRKTAVISSGKMHRLSTDQFKQMGMQDKLYGMIRDGDAAVCCNAIVVLNEALEEEGSGIAINKNIIYFLLNRLRDFNEWQQCLVLNLCLKYVPDKKSEMFDIMNVLEERLRGSNSAVILATTNVFINLTQNIPEVHYQVYERLKEPLLTLMSVCPLETSYACLCHIKLLISREPEVFADSFKDFYIRYTDPHYIRTLKLEILVAIANDKNVKEILEELSVFATDVQPETSRGSIYALGQIALKLPSAAEQCTKYFLEFLETEQEYIRAETFVILKDFMRKYTDINKLKPFFPVITKNWKSIEDKDSKVAFIWMLGEFGEDIDDAPYILESYVTNFNQEPYAAKIELLTACMKLFFKRPPEMRPILGPLLSTACTDFTHADVHDRALLYYRMLLKNPRVASQAVNGKKEAIITFNDEENAEIKDKLFEEFNTLSVIYGIPAERFIDKSEHVIGAEEDDDDEEEEDEEEEEEEEEEDEDEQGQGLLSMGGARKVKSAVKLEADPQIEPQIFQTKWGQLPVRHTIDLRLRAQPDSDAVERLLANHRIMCMASGQVGTSFKFYFYGQSMGVSDLHCLAESVIEVTGNMKTVVKGDDPKVDEFASTLRAALKPFT
eukprot:TRINITY_DN67895_c8_g2_i1.p1 TRINITY_DN67895_c8_g2~~TRINITY_DN67895_c8_g2_i1.p1  ORF type:complete len:787 (+),score=100.20 TRINITY_DN67895_c8_g2_i1:60-2363(+)